MKGCWRTVHLHGLQVSPHVLPANYEEENMPLQWREMAFSTLTK